MRVICSWCGKDMGLFKPLDDNSITHGMCDECLERETAPVKDGSRISDANKA